MWPASGVYGMMHAPSTCDSKQPPVPGTRPREKSVNNTGLLTTSEAPLILSNESFEPLQIQPFVLEVVLGMGRLT